MLLRTQIIAVAMLASGIPLLGQDQKPDANPSAYRERLRTNSGDPQSDRAPDSDASREAYKERLRHLSADSDHREQGTGKREQVLATDEKSSATGTAPATKDAATGAVATGSAESVSSQTPAQPKSLEPVSLQQKGPQSSTAATSVKDCHSVPCNLSPVTTNLPTGCSDAYCKDLRRVADGHGSPGVPNSGDGRSITTERNFIKNLAFDQVHIWESPFKMRDSDATWAVPFGIVTGSLIATDRDVSKQLAKPSRQSISKNISDAGLLGFIGAGAGFYGLGLLTHDDHKRETGLLAGVAAVNATFVGEALKLGFGRQRPFDGDHFGHIGRGGSSFPSGHAIDSWAIATVFAHEYPNPFMQVAAYGLASAVSATRVTAGQHFPSDVLVGSALGYLIGRKIYNDHHNPELDGAEYGTFVREHKYEAANSGSAYVPLESWVYPVIDRLAALGFVKSNFDSERPFTRLECARLAAEAAETAHYDASPDVESMVDSLQKEFSRESEVWAGGSANRSAELESIYTRVTEISGPILRDGYHFGQTLYNDYGRPYGRGLNYVTGLSARATSGPLVFYFRGEYQHAPGNPDYSSQLKAQITAAEAQVSGVGPGTPQLNTPFPAESRFRVLDAYLGVNFGGNQLTLGQQSLWWGPGTGGPLMFTNNAEPLKMIRLTRVSPLEIPLLSKVLGPLRYDMFLGQTDGYHYILTPQGLLGPHLGTQPFVQGQRFTFKPTPNFEFGFTKTGSFGGTGYPLTADYFFRTTFTAANYAAGDARKPGDRDSGLDVTYRIPKVRDWLTWYAEARSEDEISPLFFPRTSSMRSGIYAAKLPGLPHVDIRVEGVYTDVPSYGAGKGYFYFNATYRDGFTKNGNIMGDWIGRDGRGVNAASTIWLSARNSLQLGYREAVVDREFLQGGRYEDFSAKASFNFRSNLDVSLALQYEHWKFPVLANVPQRNVASSLQVTYSPKWKR